MRLRKVKYAQDIIDNNPDIAVDKPEEFRGTWHTLFENDNPIYLEIGCGKGKFITESAFNHPNIDYIGIEMMTSVICRAIQKIENKECVNCLFINRDGDNILEYFDENEIDRIYLNFSDPWPKNRHEKRRLTSKNFLRKYKIILKDEGKIFCKTDNLEFYEYSKEVMSEEMEVHFGEIDYSKYQEETTEFEDKFRAKGNPIYYIIGTFKR